MISSKEGTLSFKKLAPLAILLSLTLSLSATAVGECDIELTGHNTCYISPQFIPCLPSNGQGMGSCTTSCLMLTGSYIAGMHGSGSCNFSNPNISYGPEISCSFNCVLSGKNAISCAADCEPRQTLALSGVDKIH
jgi:hypothetical protein